MPVFFKNLFNKITSSNSSSSNEQEPKLISEVGVDKLKAIIAEVTAAFPIFEKAGFEIEELQIEVGLVPKFLPRFKQVKTISQQDQDAILQEVQNKKLVKFMLISLFKSTKMQSLIQDPKLEFYGLEIEVTAVPAVRGIFRSIKDSEKIVRLSTPDNSKS